MPAPYYTPALYAIDTALLTLLARLDDDGELTDDPLAAIDALAMERNDKIDGICRHVRERETRAAAIQAEIDRLLMAKRTEENAVDRLKGFIKESMQKLGEKKIKTPLFTVWWQANGQPTATIEDAEKLPGWAMRTITNLVPDKTAIIGAWERGESLPDGVTVETGTHLRIK